MGGRMNLMLRRRAMMTKKSKSVECPYISDGLVFWLDGIEKGNIAGAWTDLIGGYDFQIPSGVTSIADGMVFENPHAAMNHLPYTEKLTTPWQNATVEVVCTYQQSQSFPWCSSHNTAGSNGTCFCFYNGTIGIGHSQSNLYTIPDNLKDAKVHTYTVTAVDAYCDMINLTIPITEYFSPSTYMSIGCRGNGNWYYGTIKSIRIYSLQLTYAERLANAQVDNQRFNLGLNL